MAVRRESRGAVVLYPSPGMGHLVSMVEFGKVLVRRGLPVTVVVLEAPYSTGSTAAFVERVTAAHPSITFHRLPPVTLPDLDVPNPEALTFELARQGDPNLHLFLASTSPRAVVLDFFCSCSRETAAQLGIPVFFFFTSGASVLATFLYLPTVHGTVSESFKDLGETPINFPGMPPIPADHMALPLLDRHSAAYAGFLSMAKGLAGADGIIVNTFEEIEPEAVEAIRNDRCVSDGVPTPPIYCIGPLITSDDTDRDGKGGGADCLAWLDSQPKASVVFLCFGSIGRLSADQLGEVAAGLENSRQRFLWVIRSPPSDDPSRRFEKQPEPDLDLLLPAGFRERTKERGMAVKSWAPQKSVLAHPSVGGFVTHLGWNSVLEAICEGVPMVGWPLYAEQRMNKVFLADGRGLVRAMEGYDRELVTATEVETRVRWLMESEGGDELRARTAAAKEAAIAALREGGTSSEDLGRLVASLNA